MTKKMKAEENLEKEVTKDIGNVSFPSHIGVTYQKMKDTVLKFVELGGGPFTKNQTKDKMSDLSNIGMVIKRILPFLCYLGFLKRSRIGQKGAFTYKLDPEIRERLEKNPEEYNSIFTSLSKKSPGYLVIWKYAEEEKSSKFLISAFEQHYLKNKLGLKYSSRGLNAWLNALDKMNLVSLGGGFISLEDIPSPFEIPEEKRISREPSKGIPETGLPPSAEGLAPGMTFNVNVNLDYRQPPDLQREYMRWLERMSSRPNVTMSIKKRTEKPESRSGKQTDQN